MTLRIVKIQMKNPSIIPFTPFSWDQTTTHHQGLIQLLGISVDSVRLLLSPLLPTWLQKQSIGSPAPSLDPVYFFIAYSEGDHVKMWSWSHYSPPQNIQRILLLSVSSLIWWPWLSEPLQAGFASWEISSLISELSSNLFSFALLHFPWLIFNS